MGTEGFVVKPEGLLWATSDTGNRWTEREKRVIVPPCVPRLYDSSQHETKRNRLRNSQDPGQRKLTGTQLEVWRRQDRPEPRELQKFERLFRVATGKWRVGEG